MLGRQTWTLVSREAPCPKPLLPPGRRPSWTPASSTAATTSTSSASSPTPAWTSSTEGFFVAFDYSRDATDEIGRFFKQTGKAIVALTVKEILDEQIAMKLA